MRLAHVSDIHFGGEHVGAVAAAAERIAAEPLDLIVASGDLTQFGECAEFDAAKRWLESLPHARVFTPWNRYRQAFGEPSAGRYTKQGLTVVSLNSARGAQPRLNWSKGQVSARQARDAAAAIRTAPQGDLKIVSCHHPLEEITGGPMTAKVWGGGAAARAFAEAGADLVLSGHIHVPFVHAFPYANGRTQSVGAGTLSVRERGCPPSFNLIEADEAEIRVIALQFTGSHFEPMRTWAVSRFQT
ncbi:MAG: metallophosphoesterase [Caulobacterales bacterium]|nr:metallophosphoesterase [Caulobacterales bacterium]